MFRKSISILLILLMVAWSPAAYAGGLGIICRDGSCQQSISIVQRQIIDEFNVVERVDILQKTVEFDAEYFLGLNGYYDVVNELQAQEYTKDKDIILKQTEQIDKLINLLEQTLKQQQRLQNGGNSASIEPEIETPSNPDPDVEASDLNSKVFFIFSESCASCHGDKSPKKGLQLVGKDSDGTKWLNNLSLDDRVLVYDHTAGVKLKERGKKLMPLGEEPLSDSDVDIIRLWMIAKAEETKRGKKND